MLNRPFVLISALLLIGLLVWSQRPQVATEVARTALLMGTLVEIKGVGGDEKNIEKAISDAFSIMRAEEERFSSELETSQISLINRSDVPVVVDAQVLKVLRLGQKITRQSQGAFDFGMGGLKRLWDFKALTPRVPTALEIAAVLPQRSLKRVAIDGERVVRLGARVQLDLGGIAKGFAVDRALDVLRSAGLKSASINAGGDIGLLGGHGERPWKIGIQHPRKANELLATLELRDRAIVTSGDYERFFMVDGLRYHHIFDPQTGMPARGCQSVTVIAAHVAEADSLATAAFVLGPQKGLAFLETYPDVEGLIVAADGKRTMTKGLNGRLKWR
ncbi:MAG: FAD:protein FMN transferase [Geopsychrobacter sp.]|nr:FAD:protein FMN transferase [Geopsychrobacter sp.]